jgi:hypothetical protein
MSWFLTPEAQAEEWSRQQKAWREFHMTPAQLLEQDVRNTIEVLSRIDPKTYYTDDCISLEDSVRRVVRAARLMTALDDWNWVGTNGDAYDDLRWAETKKYAMESWENENGSL